MIILVKPDSGQNEQGTKKIEKLLYGRKLEELSKLIE